jgi:hypothetical protein
MLLAAVTILWGIPYLLNDGTIWLARCPSMTSEVMDSVFPMLHTARAGMTAVVGKGGQI